MPDRIPTFVRMNISRPYRFYVLSLLCLLFVVGCSGHNHSSSKMEFFSGSYTKKEAHVQGKSEGIAILDFDILTGEIEVKGMIKNVTNPSYICKHSSLDVLYAVEEIDSSFRISGDNSTIRGGRVLVFQKNNGKWVKTQVLASHGNWPCHISMSRDGNFVFVANYGGGWSEYVVDEKGQLQFMQARRIPHDTSFHFRQEASHPHMCLTDPRDQYVFVSDLGSNLIAQYDFRQNTDKASFTYSSSESGPRHICFHPFTEYFYALNELNNSVEIFQQNTASSQSINSAIDSTQHISNYSAAAIRIHPNAQFLYASLRSTNKDLPSLVVCSEFITVERL